MLITSRLFDIFYHSYILSGAEFLVLRKMLPSSRTLRSGVKLSKTDEKLENKNKVSIAVRKHDRNKTSETALSVQNTIPKTRKRTINNVKLETTSEEDCGSDETKKKSPRKMIASVNVKIKHGDQNVVLVKDEQVQMTRKRTPRNVNLKNDEISSSIVKIEMSEIKSMKLGTKSTERMCQKIMPGKNIKIEGSLNDDFTVAKALVQENLIKLDTVKIKDELGNMNDEMCGTVKAEVGDLDSFPSIDRISSDESLSFTAPKSVGKSPRKSLNNDIKEEININRGKNIEQSIDIEDAAWQPHNWKEIWENILKMRKMYTAPVDSLGCEECPDKDTAPEVFRYQTLISVMLSSQTRDEVTYAATQRLIEHGLTVENILMTPDEKIGKLIYPAGFWKSKVQFIKRTSQILKDRYNGDIPRTYKELCQLPGVGPKMANIVMSVGWNDTVGIAVDVHVHRISNRLGWVRKPTKQPEQTRKALESWLPKELWKDGSLHLVGFGQTICKPLKPKCHQCLNANLCPVGRQTMRSGK